MQLLVGMSCQMSLRPALRVLDGLWGGKIGPSEPLENSSVPEGCDPTEKCP